MPQLEVFFQEIDNVELILTPTQVVVFLWWKSMWSTKQRWWGKGVVATTCDTSQASIRHPHGGRRLDDHEVSQGRL